MHLHWGGQPNRILVKCKELARRGHEVWVSGPENSVLCERAQQAGLQVFQDLRLRRGIHPLSLWGDLRRFRAFLDREQFDVLHPHGSQDTWLTALALKTMKRRPLFVRTRHNTFPVSSNLFNRWLYGQIDCVVTVAAQLEQLVSRNGLYPPSQIVTIYDAPDIEKFSPREGSAELRESLGIDPSSPVIGMVARLAPEKGHHLLIRAAAHVVKEFPDARFLLVGMGRSQPDVEALIHDCGLERNFILTGFRTDVPDLVALMDVFVLSPVSGEALGTSILEAFCMKKPAITTKVGGTGMAVRTGETGFLVQLGEESRVVLELSGAMINLLRDPELRKRMGETGRRLVLEEFSPERLAINSEALYKRFLQDRKLVYPQNERSEAGPRASRMRSARPALPPRMGPEVAVETKEAPR